MFLNIAYTTQGVKISSSIPGSSMDGLRMNTFLIHGWVSKKQSKHTNLFDKIHIQIWMGIHPIPWMDGWEDGEILTPFYIFHKF